MNLSTRVGLFTILIPTTMFAGMGVWTTGGPPNANTSLVLETDPGLPGVLYTAIARSTDGGSTWTSYGISGVCLAAGPPGTVYLGGLTNYRSTDAGASWTRIPGGCTTFMKVDPSAPSTVYSSVAAQTLHGSIGQLLKSTDGGNSWAVIFQAGSSPNVTAMAIHPRDSNHLYVATVEGNFESDDGGSSWNQLSPPPGGPFVGASAWVIDPAIPSTMYVSVNLASGGGVFKSTDGGHHFAPVNNGLSSLEVSGLVMDPVDSSRLYAGTGDAGVGGRGVFLSMDRGATWGSMNNGLTDLTINKLAVDPLGRYLHAATNTGVFDFEFSPDPAVLVMNPGRQFTVSIVATDQRTGRTAPGVATPVNDLWGYFSIPAITGNPNNPEVFVKMLDGTAINGSYWLFYGGLTDLEYTVTVTEDTTGRQKTYSKPAGSECGGSDTAAFTP